ncbi:MAG: hypothetical protein HDT30_04465 [Clostridiales bacterium]|nr:hypothetical protein [Clostridiales bacterium]
MEYFLIQEDRKNTNKIQVKLTNKQMDEEKAQVVFVDLEEEKDRPDLIEVNLMTRKEYIVSDRMKELMMVYADEIKAEPCILMDYDRKLQENYWRIGLEVMDQAPVKNMGLYDAPEDMVLDESVLENKYIFAIEKQKTIFWIASLHFVENFLRKNMFGIHWTRLKTVYGREGNK